ncbi:MAG TPA: hypothetical protein VHW91_01155, partial [Candidatus Dormibacteraeota bacterium]|nr:hypothetical protein [Candidatus Dormibacteraeota bacterium]
MSTEIKAPETSIPQAPAAPPAELEAPERAASPTMNKPRLWHQRRVQLGAAAVVALLLIGIVGNNLIARQYTPEGAVRQFLSALQSRDAAAAWNVIQVSAPTR